MKLDEQDPLREFRSKFLIPPGPDGKECIYFTGNSLGLQPKNTRRYIEEELEDWAKFGVEGHFHARHPWLPYHENLTEMVARVVGAKPIEVVVMNTLSVNLHLMMVSFYQPTRERYKILIEMGAFPSDQYAVASQARFFGYEPRQAVVEAKAEDILKTIEEQGESIALVVLGSVNYLSGEAFDIPTITKTAQAKGCRVGFDLAHGAGNLKLKLHDWGPDFAVWCSYKYLNGGPGALGGCFVHERHARQTDLPRFAGWWGHNKKTRFAMPSEFDPIPGAEGWQLSNPPIFQLAALRASLELFDQATMDALRTKSEKLTGYLEKKIDEELTGYCTIVTPRDRERRGAQLSLRIGDNARAVVQDLAKQGIVLDFREPDIIRVAPVPLYNRFSDIDALVNGLKAHAKR